MPEESGWLDSCGENTLHRLCQLVRFDGNNIHVHHHHATRDELILGVQKALIDADPRADFTVNNWSETPLHQFVAHCGFDNTTTITSTPTGVQTNAIHGNTALGEDGHGGMDGNGSAYTYVSPSVRFVDGLLQACPKSIITANYEKEIPLHEVCTLSQLGDKEFVKFPYSSVAMGIFIQKDVAGNEYEPEHDHGQDGDTQTRLQYRARIHLQIVQNMVDCYPEGLFVLDSKNKTPLYRAVESLHCSTHVVIYILREMEFLFSSRNHPMPANANESGPAVLIRRSILGVKASVKDEGRDKRANEEAEEKVASPLQDLWNAFLSPRRVTEELAWLEKDLGLVIHNPSSGARISLSRILISASSVGGQDVAVTHSFVRRFGDLWKKALLLMCSAYHGSIESIMGKNEQEWKPIHSALFVSAPRCILSMMARLYTKELRKRDENHNCDTPLTLALSMLDDLHQAWTSHDEYEGTAGTSGDNDEGLNTNANAIQTLLSIENDTCGNSASMASIHNGQGRLPLHLALEKGLSWNKGTFEIFCAYPSAASTRDPILLTYPFMVAATRDYRRIGTIPKDGDSDTATDDKGGTSTRPSDGWLSSVYILLRADPSALRGGWHE